MNKITVELEDDEAWALAEFFKRVQFEDYERRAGDRKEANDMYDAGLAVAGALRRQGFDPR